jgi:hypothetical protein
MTRNWTSADIRRMMDDALDSFAFTFYDCHAFQSLSRDEKIAITRALRDCVKTRAGYEYLMRTVK